MKPILIDLTEADEKQDDILPALITALLCLTLLGEVALAFVFILAVLR